MAISLLGVGVALAVGEPAKAAPSFVIDNTAADDAITVSLSGFDQGMVLKDITAVPYVPQANGNILIPAGVEGFTFQGAWTDANATATPGVYNLISYDGAPTLEYYGDLLHYTFSTNQGVTSIVGYFWSDGGSWPTPNWANLGSTPILYSETADAVQMVGTGIMTGSYTSDVCVECPEPASVALFGAALLSLGLARRRASAPV